jgi:DNA-nicking Smr family endonuclease
MKSSDLHPIERPVHKKIAKGRVTIDARIDLHGMTQQIAHRALYNFLTDAYLCGDRHVLVITGKGTSSGGRGILRQVVPEWFKNPDFKELVSGFRSSAQHHGGDGALYVRLRRKHDPRN